MRSMEDHAVCPECLSPDPYATPLREPLACLTNHLQYVCGTCGRCTCLEPNGAGLCRWNFPFASYEYAVLYLRAAQIASGAACLISELASPKGRRSFRIFAGEREQQAYLGKHAGTRLLATPGHRAALDGFDGQPVVRRLSKREARAYAAAQRSRQR